MHKKIIIGTKITISLTPIPLEVTIRNKLKHSRRYHSGTISNGVEKAFEQDIISKGQAIDKPNIRTANMYTISFATLTTHYFGLGPHFNPKLAAHLITGPQ